MYRILNESKLKKKLETLGIFDKIHFLHGKCFAEIDSGVVGWTDMVDIVNLFKSGEYITQLESHDEESKITLVIVENQYSETFFKKYLQKTFGSLK